jgi:GDPmannose 4,6-dehydratase
LSDFRSILQALSKYNPDEIYNLSAQSSVGFSFEQPVETMETITGGTLNLLEAIRFFNKNIRFYNASSSECFGDSGSERANEETPFRPRSPYGVAKVAAHNLVDNYREAYGMFACNGILFNHESPLRHERFVTQKIVKAAMRISSGSDEKLKLGNIFIERDWGWAPDYVEAMWLMMQHSTPENFVIATGKSVSLKYFTELAFSSFGLNYADYIEVDSNLFRPTDISLSLADPGKAKKILNWNAQYLVEDVVERMCNPAEDIL